VDAVLARNGIALVTADHGNAEQMIDPATGKVQTAHTLNDVDFIYVAPDAAGIRLRDRGNLSDIGPTMLQILGIAQPPEMTACSLLASAC
jgi:2,3-bisphosphoglycerate-independent phosphoglycerate mutase